MNEETCCIVNEGKKAKNEWKNDNSDILPALYSVYKKIRAAVLPCLLINLFKQGYFSSVKKYKYLNNSIS